MGDWADFCESQGLDPNDHEAIDKFHERESLAEELDEAIKRPWGLAFKTVLRRYAHVECERCNGTGYLSQWKDVELGRCFLCFPDARWKELGFS